MIEFSKDLQTRYPSGTVTYYEQGRRFRNYPRSLTLRGKEKKSVSILRLQSLETTLELNEDVDTDLRTSSSWVPITFHQETVPTTHAVNAKNRLGGSLRSAASVRRRPTPLFRGDDATSPGSDGGRPTSRTTQRPRPPRASRMGVVTGRRRRVDTGTVTRGATPLFLRPSRSDLQIHKVQIGSSSVVSVVQDKRGFVTVRYRLPTDCRTLVLNIDTSNKLSRYRKIK